MTLTGRHIQQLIGLAIGSGASDDGDALPGRTGESPPAGPPQPRRTLTVGMATFDDFDGAYFTTAALRLYHPEVADRVSILVVDNNPRGPMAWSLKALEQHVEGLRYVPADDVAGTAVRDRVFREANSDWVLCSASP